MGSSCPPGLPAPTYPNFEYFPQLGVSAAIISVICYMETIAVARKEGADRGYKINGNYELIAQGLANLLGSFTAAPLGTGSLSRTAVVMASGADSQLYQIVVGLVMILVLLFVSPALAFTPYCSLSAIILVAVYGLFEFSHLPKIWAIKKLDAAIWMLSFILTLTTSLEIGILATWGVSLLVFVWQYSRASTELLGQIPDSDLHVERKRYAECLVTPGISIIRINGPLFFGNAARIAPHFLKFAMRERSRVLVLDMGAVTEIDFAATANLHTALKSLGEAQVRVILGRVHGNLCDILSSTGLASLIGEENIFIGLPDAVQRAKILLQEWLFEAQRAEQFDRASVALSPVAEKEDQMRATCWGKIRGRVSKGEELEYLSEPPYRHVFFASKAIPHEPLVPDEDTTDRGVPLTRNLHMLADKTQPA
jgi:SulP family sulfate permease